MSSLVILPYLAKYETNVFHIVVEDFPQNMAIDVPSAAFCQIGEKGIFRKAAKDMQEFDKML